MLFRSAATKLLPAALLRTQGDRGLAEDLIQQAFQAAIKDWAKVGHMDPRRQEAWLHKVLRYKAIDTWRTSAREHLVPGLDFDQLRAPQDTAHRALCSIELDRVLKVVFAMPAVRHRVMCLSALEGLQTKEIAELLGIAQSTVRGHLKAGRDILIKEIGPDLPAAKDDHGDDGPDWKWWWPC